MINNYSHQSKSFKLPNYAENRSIYKLVSEQHDKTNFEDEGKILVHFFVLVINIIVVVLSFF